MQLLSKQKIYLSKDQSFTNNGMNGTEIIEKCIFFNVPSHIEKMKGHVSYYHVFASVIVRTLFTSKSSSPIRFGTLEPTLQWRSLVD